MNKKIFLLPNAINSMAAAHAKIYHDSERKEYQLRISDCNITIKLWGKTETELDLVDGITKIGNLVNLCCELQTELSIMLNSMAKSKITPTRLKKYVVDAINNNCLVETIAIKNKVSKNELAEWLKTDNSDIVKTYNINFIAQLLTLNPLDVWE